MQDRLNSALVKYANLLFSMFLKEFPPHRCDDGVCLFNDFRSAACTSKIAMLAMPIPSAPSELCSKQVPTLAFSIWVFCSLGVETSTAWLESQTVIPANWGTSLAL